MENQEHPERKNENFFADSNEITESDLNKLKTNTEKEKAEKFQKLLDNAEGIIKAYEFIVNNPDTRLDSFENWLNTEVHFTDPETASLLTKALVSTADKTSKVKNFLKSSNFPKEDVGSIFGNLITDYHDKVDKGREEMMTEAENYHGDDRELNLRSTIGALADQPRNPLNFERPVSVDFSFPLAIIVRVESDDDFFNLTSGPKNLYTRNVHYGVPHKYKEWGAFNSSQRFNLIGQSLLADSGLAADISFPTLVIQTKTKWGEANIDPKVVEAEGKRIAYLDVLDKVFNVSNVDNNLPTDVINLNEQWQEVKDLPNAEEVITKTEEYNKVLRDGLRVTKAQILTGELSSDLFQKIARKPFSNWPFTIFARTGLGTYVHSDLENILDHHYGEIIQPTYDLLANIFKGIEERGLNEEDIEKRKELMRWVLAQLPLENWNSQLNSKDV